MSSYVDVAAMAPILGSAMDADRAATAAQAASDWIDARAGAATGFPDPVPARITQLALNAALRFYHDPEAPYGVIGGTADVPMYMRSLMTDSEPLLLGLRSGFGLG